MDDRYRWGHYFLFDSNEPSHHQLKYSTPLPYSIPIRRFLFFYLIFYETDFSFFFFTFIHQFIEDRKNDLKPFIHLTA